MAKRRKTPFYDGRREAVPLSAAWIREIERRVKDLRDSTRYVIVSVMLPGPPRKWELFYDVSDDMWAMEIAGATLFKRKRTARAVADLLGDRYQIVEVKLGRKKKVIRPRMRASDPKRR
jgi:hypothetical protein